MSFPNRNPRGYQGNNSVRLPNIIIPNPARDPTTSDNKNVEVMDEWLNPSTKKWFKLISLEAGIADWQLQVSSGTAIDSIAVQTGTSPVTADSDGMITFNGAIVAAGSNPVRSDGTGANTLALEVQISQAIASTNADNVGLCAFDSAQFSVDANGFVQLVAGTNISELDGNTGTASGDTVNIIADLDQGTARFTGDNLSTLTLGFTDAARNIGIGTHSLMNVTSGQSNVCIGYGAGASMTVSSNNALFGDNAGANLTTSGGSNTAIGVGALAQCTTGVANCGLGRNALANLDSGIRNLAVGFHAAGSSYTGAESDNVLINNTGTLGESHVMRIGTHGSGDGQVDECYLAGVNGNTVASPELVTIDSSTHQLGVLPFETGNWTPVFTASATPPTGVTYSVQTGNYVRIGNTVILWFDVRLTSKGSGGTGTVLLSGLPFTPTTQQQWYGSVATNHQTFQTSNSAAVAYAQPTGTIVLVEYGSGTAAANSTWLTAQNDSFYIGCILYQTSS